MGSSKLVVFLCLAVLASSTQARSPDFPSVDKHENIFDHINASLSNLTETVKAQVDKALGTIQGLSDQLEDGSESLINQLATSIDGVVKGLVDNINNLTNDVDDSGGNSTDCVGTSLTDITELPGDSILKANDCVSAKAQNTSDLINKKKLKITKILEDLSSLAKDLNKCKKRHVLLQPICIAHISAEIAFDRIILPKEINLTESLLTKIVPKSIAHLATCQEGVVTGVRTAGTEIVQQVAECLNQF